MAFLCLSSSLLSAQQPFPTWVDISQQYLMYIWPLMLSLHVPEPEAQLKLTTPEALPPSLEPTLCLLHIFLSYPLLFLSIPPFNSSPLALLPLCTSALPSPSHLWLYPLFFLYFISFLFNLQYIPKTRMPALLCSLIFFLYGNLSFMGTQILLSFPLGNSCAGNLRTPISTHRSFPYLIHGLLHVETIPRPHLFHLIHIW